MSGMDRGGQKGRLRVFFRYPVACAIALVGLIVTLDHYSGVHLRLFPLYFVPISLLASTRSLRMTLGAAAILSIIWAVANYDDAHQAAVSANIFSQFLAFATVGYLVNINKRRADQQELLASTDALTGLLNSRAFHERAGIHVALQRRAPRPMTLAYLDVDNFKQVNTTLGHIGADELLQDVSAAMQASLRESDLIGRLGGDEFAILLPATGLSDARYALQRLRKAVFAKTSERAMPITVSIGAVVFESPVASVSDMLEASDQLMYRVKGQTKDDLALCRVEELKSETLVPA